MKWMTKLYSILTFLPLVVSALVLPLMPEKVPLHYNLAGQIDRWGSPFELLFLPLFTLVAALLMRHLIIPRISKKTPANTQALISAICCVLLMADILTVVMLFSAFFAGSFADPGVAFVRIINVAMGLMLIPLGNIMPKVKRNGVFGLRTKWSMANDTCWNLCQRMGGLSLMLTGVLIVVGTLLIPDPALNTPLMLALILLDALFCVVYSYKIYQKYGQN